LITRFEGVFVPNLVFGTPSAAFIEGKWLELGVSPATESLQFVFCYDFQCHEDSTTTKHHSI